MIGDFIETKQITFNNENMEVYVCKSLMEKLNGATILKEPDKKIKGMLFVYDKPVRNGYDWLPDIEKIYLMFF